MLLMLLIGWIVLLPALVVAGLHIASSVLGRRRAAPHGYEDLFEDEQTIEAEIATITLEAFTGLGPATTRSAAAPSGPPASEARVGTGH